MSKRIDPFKPFLQLMSFIISSSLFITHSAWAAPTATTQVICQSASGALTVKAKCKKTETRLSMSEVVTAAHGVLPSGTVVRGVIGGRLDTTDADLKAGVTLATFTSSLPPSVIASGVDDVAIADLASFVPSYCSSVESCFSAEERASTAQCTGTGNAPTSPAGVICLYRVEGSTSGDFTSINAREVAGIGGGIDLTFTTAAPTTTNHSAGLTFVWVYTAP